MDAPLVEFFELTKPTPYGDGIATVIPRRSRGISSSWLAEKTRSLAALGLTETELLRIPTQAPEGEQGEGT
jgi:hypothetical protein